MGAGVLTVIGVSTLAFPHFPGLGLLYELNIGNMIALPYIIAAVCLISALVLSTYISPEEHLWGNDDPGCDKEKCRHTRH